MLTENILCQWLFYMYLTCDIVTIDLKTSRSDLYTQKGNFRIFGRFILVLFVVGGVLKYIELKVAFKSFPSELNYTTKFQAIWPTKIPHD